MLTSGKVRARIGLYFYSSVIYHKVAPFIAKEQNEQQKKDNVTPGRIRTVLFFPTASYEALEGKEKG